MRAESPVKISPALSRRKIIGLGEFDSGVPDLATNKKYMEGFGRD